MKKIKALIVDDERLAREEIKRHLHPYAAFEIVGEAENVSDAEKQVNLLKPDIIFLDVQMPDGSGFDLLESLSVVPEIIFTTAFDQYAVQAFEVNALDYLVKPVREERFAKAVEKIMHKFTGGRPGEQVSNLFVKEGERCYFIKPGDISLIESSGNYARLYFNDKKVLIKRSLNQLEAILDNTVFLRINRTIIVNKDFITQMKPLADGRLMIYLPGDKNFTVSVRRSALFKSHRL